MAMQVEVEIGVCVVIWYLNMTQDPEQILLLVTRKRFFSIMYICHGYRRKRLVLDCSRFYSREELFHIVRTQHRGSQISLEHGPNLYQILCCDIELRLACSMAEANIASHQSDEDRLAKLECDEDRIHTDACNAKIKRKSKIQSGDYGGNDKTKMFSNIDTVTVPSTLSQEETGETCGVEEIEIS